MAVVDTWKNYEEIMLNEKITKCSIWGNMVLVGIDLGRHLCLFISPWGSDETNSAPEMNV